jgi:catalase
MGEASSDKLLHGRLFSYPDTQRHLLRPMRVEANGGAAPS